jgi:hypothetical protein
VDISEFLSSELDAMLRFARVLVGDRGTDKPLAICSLNEYM